MSLSGVFLYASKADVKESVLRLPTLSVINLFIELTAVSALRFACG